MKTFSFLIVCLMALTNISCAQQQSELLWPAGAPGAAGTATKDKPTLIAYPVEKQKSSGSAIVILPGGGYGALAMDHEGHQIARWLNELGISAFICDYRHRGKGYGHPAPMQDAQRAIRTVRSLATQHGYRPDQIGVLGFSAGGHLASTVATHFDGGNANSGNPIEKQSSRPDFVCLCYPVIAFGEPYTHRGSQRNLLGKDASAELIQQFSNEKQVSDKTPPTFLWHTSEDKSVPPENSLQFYLALQKSKVPCELHIYEKGRHGIGLGKEVSGASEWPKAFEKWLTNRELIK